MEKTGKKINLFLFLFLVLVFKSLGQSFVISANKTNIGVGDYLELTFTLENGEFNNFPPPQFEAFSLINGPFVSNSTTIINGVQSSTNSLIFVYKALKPGKFSIPSMSLKVNKKTIKSNSLLISVSNSPSSKKSPAPNPNEEEHKLNPGEDIFVELISDKTKVYVGEQVTLSLRIYSKYPLKSYNFEKKPNWTGFWIHEIPLNGQVQLSKVTKKGKVFNSGIIDQIALFPQKSGEFVLDEVILNFLVKLPKKEPKRPSGLDNFFDDFFDDPFINDNEVNVKVISNKLKLTVLALPDPKPNNFSGMTGNFKWEIKTDINEVKRGEPLTLSVNINGVGNLKMLPDFTPIIPDKFEVFDPKITENIAKHIPLSGSKTMEFLIVPDQEGDFIIPSQEFYFFDPNSKSYKNLKSNPISIKVLKNDKLVNNDKQDDLKPLMNFVVNSFPKKVPIIYILILIFGIGLFPLINFFKERHLSQLAFMETQEYRSLNAHKIALKKIEALNDSAKIYDLRLILDEYIINKLALNKLVDQYELEGLINNSGLPKAIISFRSKLLELEFASDSKETNYSDYLNQLKLIINHA